MNKISLIKSPRRKKPTEQPIALATQGGRDELGGVNMLYKIDLASSHFRAQFMRAFELSVASARKDNKHTLSRKNIVDAIE